MENASIYRGVFFIFMPRHPHMSNPAFLDGLAAQLLADYPNNLHQVQVVLPSRRAKVFLTQALRNRATSNIFAPRITNIEDFVRELSGMRVMEPVELLFEFYHVYISLQSDAQGFDVFSNWAQTLLQDFNEIDRYLIDPKHVLEYLKNIEDIRRWGQQDEPVGLARNYVDFWKMLPVYYDSLRKHLAGIKAGYQGMIYREAVAALANYTPSRQIVFAGFNALNKAEEQIFKHLLAHHGAKAYWDADKSFLGDELHGAGLFLNRIKNNWSYYRSRDFQWVFDQFSQPKDIEVIGTAKSVGQARIAGSIVQDLIERGQDLSRTAIVLGDESLLVPLLHALPAATGPLNITMGLPGKNNPAQILITKMFRMHTAALRRSGDGYVFYHKDVTDILSHPLVNAYPGVRSVLSHIIRNNYSFIPHATLLNFGIEPGSVPAMIFARWDNPSGIIGNLLDIVQAIRQGIPNDESSRVTLAFLHASHQMLNKLSAGIAPYENLLDADLLHSMYKQAADLTEVSFEGEPLAGLQIMGILESRVLDFENVIVLSMNEGKLPAGKSGNSFIPNDLKRELGLPTYKEKDAVYTYHFYHLLQRALRAFLIYNNDSEGFDGGEKSRFITQLEVEKKPAHNLSVKTYAAYVPPVASRPLVIEKTPLVMERLRQIAEDGFSPSALTAYIRNPVDFYYRKILRIREAEDVEENIAVNTLGTIIHETLKALYEPFVGGLLSVPGLERAIKLSSDEVHRQFKLIYREGEIRRGRNLLAFEVAKRHVLNFFRMELEDVASGAEISIVSLETNYGRLLEHPQIGFPVKIAGNVDRIDIRNGQTRIIDYKTGRVDPRNLKLKDWDSLIHVKHDKIIQVLSYAFMYCGDNSTNSLTAGIWSFKNMRAGYMPFVLEADKAQHENITPELLADFQDAIAKLIAEILDPAIPFEEKEVKFS